MCENPKAVYSINEKFPGQISSQYSYIFSCLELTWDNSQGYNFTYN